MKQKVMMAVVFLMIAATLVGCARRKRVVVVHPTYGNAVVIQKGHVHGARCGHFRHGNTWYVAKKGHVHGDGCGHHYVNRVWVVR